jgi:predicted RecB family nuclease
LISFLVGIFPEEWINLVVAKVRGWFGIASSETVPLSLIDGIDYTMEAYLNDVNIDSIQTLANLTDERIENLQGIDKDVVKDWQRQAKLYNAIDDRVVIERLHRIAINDIEDLKLFTEIKLAEDKIPEKNLTSILVEEDINKARAKPEYWSVLIRVLKEEYDKQKPT